MTKNRLELLKEVEQEYLKKDKLSDISIGDTVKVHFKIREGKRERVQIFEGVVIGIKGKGIGKTLTVRKVSFNVGVERVFPLHSPKIESIVLVRRGRVRRAKLYYLRGRRGKSAQVKRYIEKKEEATAKAGVESKNLLEGKDGKGKDGNKAEENKKGGSESESSAESKSQESK